MTTATVEKPKVTVSHREAQLLLPTIPFEKHGKNLTQEQRAAVEHYIDCDECQTAGLDALLGLDPLTHQRAIEVWLCRDMTGMMSDAITPFSLGELRAIEHIFGRQLNKDKKTIPIGYVGRFGECQHAVCKELRERSAPLVGRSIDRQADCHRAVLRGYVAQGWSTHELTTKQATLMKKFVVSKSKLACERSNVGIDTLCKMVNSAAHQERTQAGAQVRELVVILEPLLHENITLGTCDRFGSPSCGLYAQERDCGTNCHFLAMMTLRLYDFYAEQNGIGRRR